MVLVRNMRHIVLHIQHTVETHSSSAEMQGRAKLISRQLQSFKTVTFMHFILMSKKNPASSAKCFKRDTSTITTVCTALERVELGVSAVIGRPAQHLHENSVIECSCSIYISVSTACR